MTDILFQTILVSHVLTGAIALLSGLTALGLFKKTHLHRPAGKTFFYSMIIVFITAVILSIRSGIEFLFCIAILSFFSTFYGVRALSILKGAAIKWFDWLGIVAVFLSGLYIGGLGAYNLFKTGSGNSVLFTFFGLLMLFVSTSGASELIRFKPGDIKWFKIHQSSMGGALIATITAFSANTLNFLPGLVQWLWPTVLLVPMLSFIIRKNSISTIK